MSILDWFKNRPAQFDTDHRSDEMTLRAIEKAVSLTNPRLKLLSSYQERLTPAVETTVSYLREAIISLPPAIQVSASQWSADPALKAFFVAAQDISEVMSRSQNLRTLFDKYPSLDEAYFILGMKFSEQKVMGMSLRGEVIQRDAMQTFAAFSDHQARICGQSDVEVRRLLGAQVYEYLVAQAISEIGEERSERRELQDNRALIRARLRLLQNQGPGLGSVFGAAPSSCEEQCKLEAQLLENERQLEAIGSPQSVLEAEMECLCEVLGHPEHYVRVELKQLRLSAMNIVVGSSSDDVAAESVFPLAQLMGAPKVQRAFIMGRFARNEFHVAKMNFDDAARYL